MFATLERGFDSMVVYDAPEYITVREAAQLLRVHRRTIERMIDAGKLAGVIKVGNRLRIPKKAIEDYKRDQRID